MLESFYERMDAFLKEIGINIEGIDSTEDLISCESFVAIFEPQEPIIID